MKKLLLAIVCIIAISCGSKEDNSCTCVQEKWERSVVKDIATQNIVSTSAWQVSGSTAAITDCDTNGVITSSGSGNAQPIGNGQYVVTEYKYQIKCN